MKRISHVRAALHGIEDALRDDPDFEWRDRGNEHVLWEPEEVDDANRVSIDIISEDDEHAAKSADDLIPVVDLPPEIEADRSSPLLGQSDSKELKARIPLLGVEALAWYMPFHQKKFQWGCYLSAKGILYLADLFLPLKLSPSRRIQLAVHALLRHEATHFAVEYMASQWELSVGVRCYWPARAALKNPTLGYNLDEEKLANAYMLRGFRYPANVTRVPGAVQLIRKFTRSQPPGYSDGEHFTDSNYFAGLMSSLAHDYVQCFPPPTYLPHQNGLDLLSYYPHPTLIDLRYVPIFVVSDTSLAKVSSLVLRIIPRVDRVQESESFTKMLARMRLKLARFRGELLIRHQAA